jgi:hypothetical protein
MLIATADEILRKGREMGGFNLRRQQSVKRTTCLKRFRALYGFVFQYCWLGLSICTHPVFILSTPQARSFSAVYLVSPAAKWPLIQPPAGCLDAPRTAREEEQMCSLHAHAMEQMYDVCKNHTKEWLKVARSLGWKLSWLPAFLLWGHCLIRHRRPLHVHVQKLLGPLGHAPPSWAFARLPKMVGNLLTQVQRNYPFFSKNRGLRMTLSL